MDKSIWNQLQWFRFVQSEIIKFLMKYQIKRWNEIKLREWDKLRFENSSDYITPQKWLN